MSDIKGQELKWLTRNCVECLPEAELKKRIDSGKKLRVKLGIDPTAPDIHLGHTVVLQKLREFQELGHNVVLIIGDYTARVGDPSGQSSTRPVIEPDEIERNAGTFQEQAFKILKPNKTTVKYNSSWLDMKMFKLYELMRSATVAQILERDDFEKRFKKGQPISMLEMLYPLLQGYDSVEVEADVELGGTDQKFNLLMGRHMQQQHGMPQQVVMTMPILPGTDGVQRMSKSTGNYIGITEPKEEIFGKLMSIPDSVMPLYYDLLLGERLDEAQDPNQAKRALARCIVDRFCGSDEGAASEQLFDRVHKEKQVPEEIEVAVIDSSIVSDGMVHMPALISEHFGGSRSDARRMIEQGGVKLDGAVIVPDQLDISAETLGGKVLQVGKRKFLKIVLK